MAGCALIIWSTPYGAGISRDSITYIGGAESLISGQGYAFMGSPISHYPPLYPMFLAAMSLPRENLAQAARLLNALLFGLNISLIAVGLYLIVGRNFFFITAAALFCLSSGPLILLHTYAWSEPLFIAFSIASVIFLLQTRTKSRYHMLAISGFCLGFAMITRYVGVAFLPPALCLVFFAGENQPVPRRIRSALFYFVAACAPLGGMILRNAITTGSAANRGFAFHPIKVSQFFSDFHTVIINFFIPAPLPSEIKSCIFWLPTSLFIILGTISFQRWLKHRNWRSIDIVITTTSLFFIVSYTLLLFLTISFVDASTSIDTRLLSPIFIILIMGGFSSLWFLSKELKKPAIIWFFLLLISISISMKVPDAARTVTSLRKDGRGYAARYWRNSETITFVNLLEDELKIYSNGIEAVYFLADRQATVLPEKQSRYSMKINQGYNEEMKALCSSVMEDGALLVYFNGIYRWYFPTEEEIKAACDLPVLQKFSDGTVYGGKRR